MHKTREHNAKPIIRIPFLVVVVLALVGLGAFVRDFHNVVWQHENCAKAGSDMHSMAVGLISYSIDNQAYPGTRPLKSFAAGVRESTLAKIGAAELSVVDPGVGSGGPLGLTTPIAYCDMLYKDPFSLGGDLPYAYYPKNGGYLLLSPGPDGRYDINPLLHYAGGDNPTRTVEMLVPRTYDVTNGTISPGDIWRLSEKENEVRWKMTAP